MIYSRPSESRPVRQEEEEGPQGVLNAYSWATGAPSSSYQGSGPILQGISKQAMGSRRQNTDEPPSTQAPATQDWGLSRALSFQYKNFTHFNGHYNFKESNFHHCPVNVCWGRSLHMQQISDLLNLSVWHQITKLDRIGHVHTAKVRLNLQRTIVR